MRSSYSDAFYAQFAREAIEAWKNEVDWGDCYREYVIHDPTRTGVGQLSTFCTQRCGILVLDTGTSSYAKEAFRNDVALGARTTVLDGDGSVRGVFPSGAQCAFPDEAKGYLNFDGGWANATQGVARMMAKVKEMGGQVLPGKDVVELLRSDGKVTGVKTLDGTVFLAAWTVLATGSWTASAFRELNLGSKCHAVGCYGSRSRTSKTFTNPSLLS